MPKMTDEQCEYCNALYKGRLEIARYDVSPIYISVTGRESTKGPRNLTLIETRMSISAWREANKIMDNMRDAE